MKHYSYFNLPNWKNYQKILLDFYHNDHGYDLDYVDPEDGNFMKILGRVKAQKILPDMIQHFDDLDIPVSFVMTLGRYTVQTDPYDYIHKDYSPVEDIFYMGDYAVNFVLENTENSFLVLFDDNKKEVERINYDHNPVLLRTNQYHSVLDYSEKLRMVVTIRFDVGTDLEKYF